jgi:hypothetical protein
MSGAPIVGCGPSCKALSSTFFRSTLSVKFKFKDLYFSFDVLNIYNPSVDQIPFQEELIYVGAFNNLFLVVGGDLNFPLSRREIWGDSTNVDNQRDFFLSLLSKIHLVDLEPIKIVPPSVTRDMERMQWIRD